MDLTISSTIADCLKTLKRFGAASMKFTLRDDAERPLAFVSVVRGKAECAEAEAAFNVIEGNWHEKHGCGSTVIGWTDARKQLPDDETRVMFAAGEEVEVGYHADGRWITDSETTFDDSDVYAWAHLPAAPEPTAKPEKKGGAS